MKPFDTAAAAQAVQEEVWRRMSGEQRMQIAFEMSVFVRELAIARLREEHPVWSRRRLVLEHLRSSFPDLELPAVE
jgi:hypothetical protein